MSESNPMPQLSLAPSAPVPEAESSPAESIQQTAAPVEETAPGLDESQLTEAEKKAIEDFIKKVDVSNPDHVLLFGADAQKKIADFSQTALDAVKTQYGDLNGGESGDGLLPVGVDGYDTVGISAEVEQLREGRLVLGGYGQSIPADDIVVAWVLRLPCQRDFVFEDFCLQFQGRQKHDGVC